MVLQRGKVIQAMGIVAEENIDLWVTIGKETVMNSDPVVGLISTGDFGSLTAVLITTDRNICLTGHLDYDGMIQTTCFDEVRGFDKSFKDEFFKLLDELSPKTIALNYSQDVASDGLTHGLWLKLMSLFKEYGYKGDIVSSEKIIGKLRGRKTSEEVDRIKRATIVTESILKECIDFIKPGITQLEVFEFCHKRIEEQGHDYGWAKEHNPGVMVGNKGASGHAGPTNDVLIEKGDLVTLDFGVRVDGYSSDIQRVFYVLNDGETEVPESLTKSFEDIQQAIKDGMAKMKPGTPAYVPDRAARDSLAAKGLPEFNFGFGHQVGRETHDGGVMMGPQWERYQGIVEGPLEVGMCLTVDVNLAFENGKIGQEDVAYVGVDGASLISTRQKEIYICRG